MQAISTPSESIAILIAVAASAFVLGTGIAKADPGQNCRSEWNTMYNVPIGVRTTCFNPDGSYHVCTSLGTDGNGPGTCWDSGSPSDAGTAHIQPAGAGNAASAAWLGVADGISLEGLAQI
jgi:hypothetical protein